MRKSVFSVIGLFFLAACRSVTIRPADASPSVFTLFVVAQEHPCSFHPVERDDLFGPLPFHGCKSRRIASGFVIGADGQSLTNHHVVENAVLIEAAFGDEARRVPMYLVGSDPETDVALLRMEGPPPFPPPLPVAQSSLVRVGDAVHAIGAPLGLSGTTTRGIVSHTNRFLPETRLVAYLQTDVGLHPGNSGGPLLDSGGKVIGINTALVHSEGLGFAVPIDLALRIADELSSRGRVERGTLGFYFQPLEPELAAALGLPAQDGLLVTDVSAGGPAEAAGISAGEAVVRLNGARIDPALSYEAEIAMLRPGSVAVLGIACRSGERDASVRVDERGPSPLPRPVLAVSPLSMTLGESPDGSPGALILEVEPGGAAESAGLARDDRIVEASDRPVHDLAEFRAAAQSFLTRGGRFLIRVRRKDRHLYAVLVR